MSLSDSDSSSAVLVEHNGSEDEQDDGGEGAGMLRDDRQRPARTISSDARVVVTSDEEDYDDEPLLIGAVDGEEKKRAAAAAYKADSGSTSTTGEPRAVQIVSIVEARAAKGDKTKKPDRGEGREDEVVDKEKSDEAASSTTYSFQFERGQLKEIMDRVPPNYKVSVVSVVGAFRTGKSFLLSWFLRYLRSAAFVESGNNEPTGSSGDGQQQQRQPWYKSFDSIGREGFEWKAGSERHTTGIWMWSHPFLIGNEDGDEPPVAVLLVDTQGMFDHETTMKLTACIFGFSTLLSSYQIYNVDKRVQEDNLQQLALFSEYARAAVNTDQEGKGGTSAEDDKERKQKPKPPFQHIEFLVRDWQHFDTPDDDERAADAVDYAALEKSMETYLDRVLSERDAKDLKETREQITTCFEEITCYALCHPGFPVTKKKYAGDVKDLEPVFLRLLDRYCQKVFSPKSLQPKVIHGRALTATELFAYIEAYAAMFASDTKFPTAATMLEATASANNTNAVNLALTKYKEQMNRVSGPDCSNYLEPDELKKEHSLALRECLGLFDSMANFGSADSIRKARGELAMETDKSFIMYNALNEGRNPWAGLATYVLFKRHPVQTCFFFLMRTHLKYPISLVRPLQITDTSSPPGWALWRTSCNGSPIPRARRTRRFVSLFRTSSPKRTPSYFASSRLWPRRSSSKSRTTCSG